MEKELSLKDCEKLYFAGKGEKDGGFNPLVAKYSCIYNFPHKALMTNSLWKNNEIYKVNITSCYLFTVCLTFPITQKSFKNHLNLSVI